MERAVIRTPVGPVGVEAEGGAVTGVRFARGEHSASPAGGVLDEAAGQLNEYFLGQRREFRLPLRRPAGSTAFQNRVWDALLAIPYGETRTYGQLARELGTGARAIGGWLPCGVSWIVWLMALWLFTPSAAPVRATPCPSSSPVTGSWGGRAWGGSAGTGRPGSPWT